MDIRKARKERGITQQELAQRLGVNRATISKYESGQISIPLSQALAIAEALDMAFFDLSPELLPENVETKQSSFEVYLNHLSRKENRILNDLVTDYQTLNIAGMEEAARSVNIIAGNPSYQREKRTESPMASPVDDTQS